MNVYEVLKTKKMFKDFSTPKENKEDIKV